MANKRISVDEEIQNLNEPSIRITDTFETPFQEAAVNPIDNDFVKLGKALGGLSKGLQMMHEAGEEDRITEAQADALNYDSLEESIKTQINDDIKRYNTSGDRSGRTLEFFKYHHQHQAKKFANEYNLGLMSRLEEAKNDPDIDVGAIQDEEYQKLIEKYPTAVTESMYFRTIQGEAVDKYSNAFEAQVIAGQTKIMRNQNIEAWTETMQDALLQWSENGGQGDLINMFTEASDAFYKSDTEAIKLNPQQMGDIQVAAILDYAKQNAGIGDVDDVQELLTLVEQDGFTLKGVNKAAVETLKNGLEKHLQDAEKVSNTRGSASRTEITAIANGLMYEFLATSGKEGKEATPATSSENFLPWLEGKMQGFPEDVVAIVKYKALDDLKTNIRQEETNQYTKDMRARQDSANLTATEKVVIQNKMLSGVPLSEIKTYIDNPLSGISIDDKAELHAYSELLFNQRTITAGFNANFGASVKTQSTFGTLIATSKRQLADFAEIYGKNTKEYVAQESQHLVLEGQLQSIYNDVLQSFVDSEGVPQFEDIDKVTNRLNNAISKWQEAQKEKEATVVKADTEDTTDDNDSVTGALARLNAGTGSIGDKAIIERHQELLREIEEGAKDTRMVGQSFFSRSTLDKMSLDPNWGDSDPDTRTQLIKTAMDAYANNPEDINTEAYAEAIEDYTTDLNEFIGELNNAGRLFYERVGRNSNWRNHGKDFRKYGGQYEDGVLVRRGITIDEIKSRTFVIDGEKVPMSSKQYIHPKFNPLFDSYDDAISASREDYTKIFNVLDPKVQHNLFKSAEADKVTVEVLMKDLQARLLEQQLFMRAIPLKK